MIVAAFNRRETLSKTLDSLQAQTYREWEVIVVDDGSSDGTFDLAEEYASRDRRIRVHRQENGGVSSARNAGIERARSRWLFFLDADDWIVPAAFERMIAAAEAEPRADAVVGGCLRVDDDGRELEVQAAERSPDLFTIFARTCAIVIHSCLVKTELVRRVGCFDESLVTCEDWDLWQRVSRVGARFAAIADVVGVYRMRDNSASRSGWRMLHDGLVVIDRGHGEDPRLQEHRLPERRRLSAGHRDIAKTYFACYAAGLEIAAGRDPGAMVGVLEDGISEEVDPDGVAETVFLSVAAGRAVPRSDWAVFPPSFYHAARAFITALGDRIGDRWFSFVALNALERLVLSQTREERPHQTGRWYLMELDCGGAPPASLQLPEGIERILCRVRFGDRDLGDLEIPVVDGWMPDRVFADAVASAFAWDILQAFFERHLYPTLDIETKPGWASVRRDGHTLFEGALDPERTAREGIHDRVGWTLFLQELWNCHSLDADDFYNAQSSRLEHLHRARGPKQGRVELDLAEPLPALRVPKGENVSVSVKVAGVPLTVVECPAGAGYLSVHRLRREILDQLGFEICRAVVREAVVMAPADARDSLRERLGDALPRSAEPEGATVIGRGEGPDGTAASRWTAFPSAVATERLELADHDGDPRSGPGGHQSQPLLIAPFDLDRGRDSGQLSDSSLRRSIRVDRILTEHRGAGARSGADDLLDLIHPLLPERARHALQLGASSDAVTQALAARAGSLAIADISPAALERARRGHWRRENVSFVQMDAFEGRPEGLHDLIVCAGPLDYAESGEALEGCLKRLASALRPDGCLLVAAAGGDREAIRSAALGTGLLDPRNANRACGREAQAYARRRSKRIALRRRLPGRRRRAQHTGARLEGAGKYASSTRMPILMYHRIAPEGNAATRRWRLHPDLFELQLEHLRENGYQSLTFAQWRAAADRRDPTPERSVMLTFDDGYADFPTHALPLLEKHGFQATVFIVTDLVGKTNAWDEKLGESIALMDWREIAGLHRAGVEFGSHSSRHDPLVSLSPEELARDLCRSRIGFHENLGMQVRSVCYPYGLHDSGVVSIAAACGFHYGVTTNEWHASFSDDYLTLPRLEVAGTESLADFAAKLRA